MPTTYIPKPLSHREIARLRLLLRKHLEEGASNDAFRVFGVLRAESHKAVGLETYAALIQFCAAEKPEVCVCVSVCLCVCVSVSVSVSLSVCLSLSLSLSVRLCRCVCLCLCLCL